MVDPISIGLLVGQQVLNALGQKEKIKQLSAREDEQRNLAIQQALMASAPTKDAYGNVSYYDPQRGWVTSLNPTVEAIVKAGQSEQLRSLTEDAARNREVRRRAVDRGREVGSAAQAALNRYSAGDRGEAGITGDIARLLALSKTGDKAGTVTGPLVRQGRGALLPQALRTTSNTGNIGETLLQARSAGRGEATQNEGRRRAGLEEASTLTNIANQGIAPIQEQTDIPNRLAKEQLYREGMQQKALAQGADNIGAASARTASAAGNPIDITGIAKLLAGGNSAGGNPVNIGSATRVETSSPNSSETSLPQWKDVRTGFGPLLSQRRRDERTGDFYPDWYYNDYVPSSVGFGFKGF